MMIELKTEQNLLEKVNLINKKYDEIAEITGERFNIFNILKVERNEVLTHSAIIGELLNPKGSHGQKDLFLKLFIKVSQLRFADEDFPYNNCKVYVEKHAGLINEEYSEGGRIDILIEWEGKAIIIENKIDAGDQKNQLLRYYNYANQKQLDFEIIYLTKEGNLPNSSTTGEIKLVDEKVKSISYSIHIIEWLELCKKEANSLPILRETLTQYIHLIKKITNQTQNNKMSKDLQNLLTTSPDNFNAAQSISNEIENVKKIIKNHFWDEVSEQILNFLGGDWKYDKNQPNWIYYYKTDCDIIGFAFDRIDISRISIGVLKNQNNSIHRKDAYKQIIDNISSELGLKTQERWSEYKYFQDLNLFDPNNIETFLPLSDKIKDNELVKKTINIFKSYYNMDKIKEYVDSVNLILVEDYQLLLDVKNKIENLCKIDVEPYENHVLRYEFKIKDFTDSLFIDVKVVNKDFSIEVFFRSTNIENSTGILENVFINFLPKEKSIRGFSIPLLNKNDIEEVANKIDKVVDNIKTFQGINNDFLDKGDF